MDTTLRSLLARTSLLNQPIYTTYIYIVVATATIPALSVYTPDVILCARGQQRKHQWRVFH